MLLYVGARCLLDGRTAVVGAMRLLGTMSMIPLCEAVMCVV